MRRLTILLALLPAHLWAQGICPNATTLRAEKGPIANPALAITLTEGDDNFANVRALCETIDAEDWSTACLVGEALVGDGLGGLVCGTVAPSAHASTHALAGADTVTVTDLASSCADADVLGGTAAGTGVECQTDQLANSFETHDTPSGTDPVADSATDTLAWLATSPITITGADDPETITVDCPTCSTGSHFAPSDLDTDYGAETITSVHDHSGGDLRIPGSGSLPGSCTGTAIYQDTSATTGQQLYLCESGSFVQQGGGGGGGDSIEDADGDTKVETEAGADDDTVRITTASGERVTVGPTGTVTVKPDGTASAVEITDSGSAHLLKVSTAAGQSVPMFEASASATVGMQIDSDGALQAMRGNAKGAGSIDLQVAGGTAANVASGTQSVITGGANNRADGDRASVPGGLNNRAGGDFSFAVGDNCDALGDFSSCLGEDSTASAANSACVAGELCNAAGPNSIVLGGLDTRTLAAGIHGVGSGEDGEVTNYAERVHASGNFAARGDAQDRECVVKATTTDATTTTLVASATGPQRCPTLSDDSAIKYDCSVIGIRTDVTGDVGGYRLAGTIANLGGTTSKIGTSVTETQESGGAAAWAAVDTANDTEDSLDLDVTGEGGKTIRWVGVCRMAYVSF